MKSLTWSRGLAIFPICIAPTPCPLSVINDQSLSPLLWYVTIRYIFFGVQKVFIFLVDVELGLLLLLKQNLVFFLCKNKREEFNSIFYNLFFFFFF